MRFEIFFHKGKKMRERINRKKWVDFEDKINHAIGKTEPKKIDKREDHECRLVHSNGFNQLNALVFLYLSLSHGQSPPSLSVVGGLRVVFSATTTPNGQKNKQHFLIFLSFLSFRTEGLHTFI